MIGKIHPFLCALFLLPGSFLFGQNVTVGRPTGWQGTNTYTGTVIKYDKGDWIEIQRAGSQGITRYDFSHDHIATNINSTVKPGCEVRVTETNTGTGQPELIVQPVASAAIVVPQPAPAAVIVVPQTTSPVSRPAMSAEIRARNSHLMARMLRQTNDARNAIAAGDSVSAVDHVNEALELIQEARTLSGGQQALNFVPIYNELESVSVIGPIVAQRQSAGIQSSGAAARVAPGATVESVSGEYTVVGVDVPAAESRLLTARQALSRSDLQGANTALAAVQNGVTMVTVASDLPLVRARENLALAAAAVKSGRSGDAAAPLKAAAQALSNYSQTPGPHVNEARNLTSEINSYSKIVAQQPAGAAARIDSWWNEVSAWFTGTPQT